jgi:hypothetical protein
MVKSNKPVSGFDEKRLVYIVKNTRTRRTTNKVFIVLSNKDLKNVFIKTSNNQKHHPIAIRSSLLDGKQPIELLPRLDVTQEELPDMLSYIKLLPRLDVTQKELLDMLSYIEHDDNMFFIENILSDIEPLPRLDVN